MTKPKIRRRDLLRLGAAGALASTLPGGLALRPRQARAQITGDQKFLFVVTASGGASIIDSFLPVTESEVRAAGGDPSRLVAYPDRMVVPTAGSPIRTVVDLNLPNFFGDAYDYNLPDFVRDHKEDMLVLTHECTSVNHVVAQERAINGNGINGGRTLMEAVAAHLGSDTVMPNCNMSIGGYIRPGTDQSLDARYRAEIINNPSLFAASTHGYAGLGNAPEASAIERARAARRRLEDSSAFGQRYADSQRRNRFLSLRRDLQPDVESANLITALLLAQVGEARLEEYGLGRSAEERALLAELNSQFPGLSGGDALHAQGALAFLLAKYGVASAVTLGPGFTPNVVGSDIVDSPIAFDFSHQDHASTQNTMWARVMRTVDGLIRMLKHPTWGDLGDGTSMWDRSLIYVATDFGRSKNRSAGITFGTGHDILNGSVMISPLLQGNSVYGSVNPLNCHTYSYNLETGEPDLGLALTSPGRDENLVIREGHIYSLVCQALGVDFPGRIDMSALVRG